MTEIITTKGLTRRYRKALTRVNHHDYPKQGAFHVRDEQKQIVKPENVTAANAVYYSPGPAPMVSWKPKAPVQSIRDLPALNIEPVFRRVESAGMCKGIPKTRTNYRPLKNPKSGETVYVKRDVAGKMKWCGVNYSDLLNPVNVAS